MAAERPVEIVEPAALLIDLPVDRRSPAPVLRQIEQAVAPILVVLEIPGNRTTSLVWTRISKSDTTRVSISHCFHFHQHI